MNTYFLFIDERKPDTNAAPNSRVRKLTGLLVQSSLHRELRSHFYESLVRALPAEKNVVPQMAEVHAMSLFRDEPNVDDADRLKFVNDLVDFVVEKQLPVLDTGYFSQSMAGIRMGERVFAICFLNMLWRLDNVLDSCIVWPVVERDNSKMQDQMFAGMIQNLDHGIARAPSLYASASINYANLGEVLYCTKRSAIGATCDILCYILHKRWLRNRGQTLSGFANALADAAERLVPVLWLDEIIWMNSV